MSNKKSYAVEIMGRSEATYITFEDMVKLVRATQEGKGRLVLVGQSFINPSSVSRIRRSWDVDAYEIDQPDPDIVAALTGPERKQLSPAEVKQLRTPPVKEPYGNV